MAGLPPGDPQLVSMIVSHLKTQGLFDQFRRDCLADVDTKPAYLNLKQRVDNFVSNHLSNHTWSPHLNKNQLRNNIRQLVLQSGMLEQGVDRIVAQVVDPKINHIFRPQVERVVREFLSPGSCSEEPPVPLPLTETKPDSSVPEQALPPVPSTAAASDAMSILDTITSLNQEASCRASTSGEKGRKGLSSEEPMQIDEDSEQDMDLVEEEDDQHDGMLAEESEEAKPSSEAQALEVKTEEAEEQMDLLKEKFTEEVKLEDEETGVQEQSEEDKEKAASKLTGKQMEDKQDDDLVKSTCQAKQKARERIKEEYSLEDSDLDGLSDITVSSVHTSDLSSFEGESDDDQPLSDSSEDGELLSDDEEGAGRNAGSDAGEDDKEPKPRRKAYVHKPFLYSRYYSDSDDEVTVEERRRSAAKDKEERLLKRQQNRERMEEKRKQKATQAEEQDQRKHQSGDLSGVDGPRAKEARKERKVLEKKMALNRRRKLDSRKEGDVSNKKKGDTGGEGFKKAEVKATTSKPPFQKLIRKAPESILSEERQRRSSSVSEDSNDTKKLPDPNRTHSFILDLEQGTQEALKQRSGGKFDRPSRKELHPKELHPKERKEKDRSLSDERAKLKQKQEKKLSEHPADDSLQREVTAGKVSPEEKVEKKAKVKSDKKILGATKDGKASVSEGACDESGAKDAKKVKAPFLEATKTEKEKDKLREKDKDKEKVKEKDKSKGEKSSVKTDIKQLLRPDSASSSEDRSDMEPGLDGAKKKEKHPKEVLKRSKSHMEDRPGDKPKSKDGEKEKLKADQDGQRTNKAGVETDKDPRRAKQAEKGRVVEKAKSKSREEIKTPSSSASTSKTDKKVLSVEGKSKGGAPIGKPDATKEKRKEGNAKEQQKLPDEPSQEKSEIKTSKKKMEKKDKIPEKKDDSQDEKKTHREDKSGKSEKSSESSVSSLSLEVEEPLKKPSALQDTSTDSDLVPSTAPTSFSDDTGDALSDITPEPEDGETELRLAEMAPLSTLVPAEADALLTLMDVCTAADARLPRERAAPEITLQEADMTMTEADMTMTEAALTLLSMDPDSTVTSALTREDAREDPVADTHASLLIDTAAAEEQEQQLPGDVQTVPQFEPPAPELPTVTSPQTLQPEETADETPHIEGASEGLERETGEISVSHTPQDADIDSNARQVPSSEEEAVCAEVCPETQPGDSLAPPADTHVVSEVEKVGGDAEECTPAVSDTLHAGEMEMSDKQGDSQQNVAETEASPMVEEEAVENDQARMETDDMSEIQPKTAEEDDVTTEKNDPHTMESDVAEKVEDVPESGPECLSTLVKQASDVSYSDSQEDEKGSEKEERTTGRGSRKRRLSTQKVTATKESGDEKDGKEEQPTTQEDDQEKVPEAKIPRRGRSSKSITEEEEQPKEAEKLEETPDGGEQTGASARESAAEDKKTDEENSTKISSQEAEQQEELQRTEEESELEKSSPQGTQMTSPPLPEEGEGAGSPDSKDTTGIPSAKLSEEMEEECAEGAQAEEEKEKDNSDNEPERDSVCPPPGSEPEGREEANKESGAEKKPDDAEEEQHQEDQETPVKKRGRRGRPSKTAGATEDADKKDKKSDEKETELNDGEEDDETKTRATTRSASRLEAERNKPSKPSTRASRQSGKEETAAGTRGTRGQAAAKGGRKPEASPPAVRTRGGQKSEEPPSKRTKR
ncbi:biorientation of chromosomes in cell division 1-like 1 isoform X2 [Genypterus blacodes]|uniref:biorientation of chromosomes in cell division 1-like 1 isoform X2 n=1 Tax=Genypterus blacodes TaxID=154954 RepID=UPI003F7707E0